MYHRANWDEREARVPGISGEYQPIDSDPKQVASAEERANAAALEVDRTYKAMEEALRHLNEVSIPPSQRKRAGRSIASAIRSSLR